MRLFVLITIVVFILTAASVVVARSVGIQAPASGWIEALRLDDCELPCWIGIIPGETSVYEAKRRINNVFGDQYEIMEVEKTRLELRHHTDGYSFAVYFPNARVYPTINEIHFYRLHDRDGNAPKVSELGSVISAPDRIHPDFDSTSLYYPKHHVIISMLRAWNSCNLRPDSFYSVSAKVPIHRPVEFFVVKPDIPEMLLTMSQRWRGFGACHTIKYR